MVECLAVYNRAAQAALPEKNAEVGGMNFV
jgi:hypothetical protein